MLLDCGLADQSMRLSRLPGTRLQLSSMYRSQSRPAAGLDPWAFSLRTVIHGHPRLSRVRSSEDQTRIGGSSPRREILNCSESARHNQLCEPLSSAAPSPRVPHPPLGPAVSCDRRRKNANGAARAPFGRGSKVLAYADLRRRRNAPRPTSAAPRSASEAGSGSTLASIVSLVLPLPVAVITYFSVKE